MTDYCPILVKIVGGKPKDSYRVRIKRYLFKLYIKIRSKVMNNKLYGSNGSVWQKVKHIPQEGEQRGILRFEYEGNWYRNEGGQTWKMIKRGRDTWASAGIWGKK